MAKEFEMRAEYLIQAAKNRNKLLARRIIAYILKQWAHYTLRDIVEALNALDSVILSYVTYVEKLNSKEVMYILDRWLSHISKQKV